MAKPHGAHWRNVGELTSKSIQHLLSAFGPDLQLGHDPEGEVWVQVFGGRVVQLRVFFESKQERS